MMDPSEIPQRVGPGKESCPNPETEWHSPTSISMSKVLNDDDLLIEILLRLGFPTTLVYAALVCKRWCHLASDCKFLSHFRKLHPPSLLGFYLDDIMAPSMSARFVPVLPQPPELTIVSCRAASFSLGTSQGHVIKCWNGRLFTLHSDKSGFTAAVHSPLCPEGGMVIVPKFILEQNTYGTIIPKEEGDGFSYIFMRVVSNNETTQPMVLVDILQNGDGVWRRYLSLATDQLSLIRWDVRHVLIDDKIYIPSALHNIVVLDLTTSSISTIQLPQGVEYGDRRVVLPHSDGASGMYLIQVKELQVCIWLHKGNNWLPVDTICLRAMCATLMMPGCEVEDEDAPTSIRINQLWVSAEFLFLEMGRCTLHLDVKCRALRKVYEKSKSDESFGHIHPFMMIWPPKFPALKDDPARFALPI
ncbi:uncharacterized protein [Aegilops tauschii subsp. strangulata]|nr:uncharacterized protein LOC109784676 [Aegilops tauschii subsp. strangulata]